MILHTILLISCFLYHLTWSVSSQHESHDPVLIFMDLTRSSRSLDQHMIFMISTYPSDLCMLRMISTWFHNPHDPTWSAWSPYKFIFIIRSSWSSWSSNESHDLHMILMIPLWPLRFRHDHHKPRINLSICHVIFMILPCAHLPPHLEWFLTNNIIFLIPLWTAPFLLRTGWTSARCRSRLAGCAAAPTSRSPGWRRSWRRGWSRRRAWRGGLRGLSRWWTAPLHRSPLPPPSPPPLHAGPGSSFSGT